MKSEYPQELPSEETWTATGRGFGVVGGVGVEYLFHRDFGLSSEIFSRYAKLDRMKDEKGEIYYRDFLGDWKAKLDFNGVGINVGIIIKK